MYQPTINLKDLPPGTMKKIMVGDKSILLTNVNGNIYAADHSCTHAYAELCEGRLEGSIIECPLHGAMFDVRDGSVQALPAVVRLKTYPVKIENAVLLVDLGT